MPATIEVLNPNLPQVVTSALRVTDGYLIVGNGRFLVKGTTNETEDGVSVSIDGAEWSEPTYPFVGSPQIVGGPAGFLASYNAGTLAFSANGSSWSAYSWTTYAGAGGTAPTIVTPHGSKFLVTDFKDGLYRAHLSADGVSWTGSTLSSFSGSLNSGGATTEGPVAVVVQSTSGNKTWASATGAAWTQGTLPSTGAWTGPRWNGSVYLTFRHNTTNAATSSDGVNWTARTLPAAASGSVVVANGRFFLFPSGQSNQMFTSSDGVSWATRTLPVTRSYWQVWYVDGVYIVEGEDALAEVHTYARSADLVGWTYSEFDGRVAYPKHNGAVFCALGNSPYAGDSVNVSYSSNTMGVHTSTDAVTWTERTITESLPLTKGPFVCGDRLMALERTRRGNDVLFTSADGDAWDARVLPAFVANQIKVVKLDGLYVSIPNYAGADYATSPDGVNWTRRILTAALGGALWDAAVADGVIVVSGPNGGMLTSPDGINWTVRAITGNTQSLTGIAALGPITLASHSYRSADSVTWTDVGASFDRPPSVADGVFIRSGNVSTDGITFAPDNGGGAYDAFNDTPGFFFAVRVALVGADRLDAVSFVRVGGDMLSAAHAPLPDGIAFSGNYNSRPVWHGGKGYFDAYNVNEEIVVYRITYQHSAWPIAPTMPGNFWMQGVASSGAYSVAIGQNRLYRTVDAFNWVEVPAPPEQAWAVAVVHGKFVAITEDEDHTTTSLSLSADGLTWDHATGLSVGETHVWSDVVAVHKSDLYVLGYNDGAVYRYDGATFQQVGSTGADEFGWAALMSLGDVLVAVSYSAICRVSTDSGVTWSAGTNAPFSDIWYAAHSASFGVLSGKTDTDGAAMAVTTDGQSWTTLDLAPALSSVGSTQNDVNPASFIGGKGGTVYAAISGLSSVFKVTAETLIYHDEMPAGFQFVAGAADGLGRLAVIGSEQAKLYAMTGSGTGAVNALSFWTGHINCTEAA